MEHRWTSTPHINNGRRILVMHTGTVSEFELEAMIDKSCKMVADGLTKKQREIIEG